MCVGGGGVYTRTVPIDCLTVYMPTGPAGCCYTPVHQDFHPGEKVGGGIAPLPPSSDLAIFIIGNDFYSLYLLLLLFIRALLIRIPHNPNKPFGSLLYRFLF